MPGIVSSAVRVSSQFISTISEVDPQDSERMRNMPTTPQLATEQQVHENLECLMAELGLHSLCAEEARSELLAFYGDHCSNISLPCIEKYCMLGCV